MKRLQPRKALTLARGAVVTFAVTALVASSASSVGAQEPGTEDQLAPDRGELAEVGEATLMAALQRDLGLTAAEVEQLIESQGTAIEQHEGLADELDEAAYAGSWLDADTGTLTVAVTDAEAADLATDAGAQATVVSRSGQELTAITEEFDALAEAEPAAMADAISWGIDVASNQVVLTVLEGAAGEFASVTEEYGEAVRIEESGIEPSLTSHGGEPFLDGAMPYNTPQGGCSVGFNVRNPSTGVGYFLTAGHCHNAGQTASHGQVIGPVVASFFPGFDDALVRVDNTGYWIQGPWMWTYPGFVTVPGWTDPPVGTAVCASGRTTGLTCGVVQAKGQSVNFGGQVVNNLTEHSACVEPGDSGGSNVTASGNQAVGTSTGAQLVGGQCLANPVSWYHPLTVSLPYYQSAYGVQLW